MSTKNIPDDGLPQPVSGTYGAPLPKIASSASEIKANQTEGAEETSERPEPIPGPSRAPGEY
jgi:hypothetical protein